MLRIAFGGFLIDLIENWGGLAPMSRANARLWACARERKTERQKEKKKKKK